MVIRHSQSAARHHSSATWHFLARALPACRDGIGTNAIARRTGVSKPTVILWKKRYAAEGTGGLEVPPKPGKPRVTDDVAIVLAALEPPPKRLGG